ncbi:MAG TPA: pitrilysin family protein [Candidatus Baltobacteraceae bacterium]|nr:pitrilysin family protein [Candidatus Baltobacteraceae bacterium]
MTAQAPAPPPTSTSDVLQATLKNGLHVVIVRNALAPAVATDMTYLVGSRDDAPHFPGMAHAQEHMMFRGTSALSTAQLGTIATALGGTFNAQTDDTLTQFQFTVPAADLDAVLRIESDRMRGALDLQSQWESERGAIEQEVLRDQSEPGADFFRDVELLAYKGTPYGHEGVGTVASFDKLTGPELKKFYDRWYAPNNAVLVVAGDVDPNQALAQIRARFDAVPSHPVPAHEVAHLQPLQRTVIRRNTTLIYPLAAVGFRLPGVNSEDFLPSFVLQGILSSARGPLAALTDSGEALETDWDSLPYVPEAQVGMAIAALPQGADPAAAERRLEAILTSFVQHGVPRELFESTKRQLITGQEESRNSISALASDWATTIALDKEPSIAREQQLIADVTLAQVNRAAKRYLDVRHAIVGELTPSASASQSAAPTAAQVGQEKPLAAQPASTALPAWAQKLVRDTQVPPAPPTPARMKLANGITLIVQPETISDSVFVYGRVKTAPALEEPQGQEGVADVLDALYGLGTRTRDRVAFQRALDDADAQVSAGSSFALEATSHSFGRAIGLLAENELQPRFDEATFELARRRTVDQLRTALGGTATAIERRLQRELLPPGDPQLREPTVDELSGLTLNDVESYYAKTMRPDETTIVVIGNTTPDAARSAVEAAFGGWKAEGPPPALDLPPVPPNGPGEVRVQLPLGQDTVMLHEIVAVPRSSPQLYPLLLGNAILGGGSLGPNQSRLFRDLRQSTGLVYSVESSLAPRRSRYELTIAFASLPANEQRIVALIGDELHRMQTEPVGDFELALAKASVVRQSVVAGASIQAIGSGLLDAASLGLPLDQPHLDAERLVGVDAAAIEHAFAEYVRPNDFVRVIEGP